MSSLLSCNRIYRINSNSNGSDKIKWMKTYRIGNESVQFKIDTGSDVNCIPIKIANKFSHKIRNKINNFLVFDYNHNKINVFGTIELTCVDNDSNKEFLTEFMVVDNKLEPLLGLETSIELRLVKRIDVHTIHSGLTTTKESFIRNNADIFDGLGEFPGMVTITLKDDAKPSVH